MLEPTHVFVSTYFYYQADFAMIAFGLGSITHDKVERIFSLTIGVSAPVVALIIRWPSSATLEVFGMLCIEAWLCLAYTGTGNGEPLLTSL